MYVHVQVVGGVGGRTPTRPPPPIATSLTVSLFDYIINPGNLQSISASKPIVTYDQSQNAWAMHRNNPVYQQITNDGLSRCILFVRLCEIYPRTFCERSIETFFRNNRTNRTNACQACFFINLSAYNQTWKFENNHVNDSITMIVTFEWSIVFGIQFVSSLCFSGLTKWQHTFPWKSKHEQVV